MRKYLPAACFMAASVAASAGTITLNNSTGMLSFATETILSIGTSPLNVMTIGSDSCSTNCTLLGTASVSGFLLSWQIQTLNPINATSTGQLFTYTFTPEPGNAGTGNVASPTATGAASLTVNDAADGGGDSATATFNFTNLAQDGQANGMFINGFVNVAAGAVTLGGNATDSAAFKTLLQGAGITFSGTSNTSASLFAVLQVTNCMNGGTLSACILSPDPTGTFSALTIGTAATGAPEPGTFALLACGMAALGLIRRKVRRRIFESARLR